MNPRTPARMASASAPTARPNATTTLTAQTWTRSAITAARAVTGWVAPHRRDPAVFRGIAS